MSIAKPLKRLAQRACIANGGIGAAERVDEDAVRREEREPAHDRVREEAHVGPTREKRDQECRAVGAAERMVRADERGPSRRDPRQFLRLHLRVDPGCALNPIGKRYRRVARGDLLGHGCDLLEPDRALEEAQRTIDHSAHPRRIRPG
jgi:hypothetical protein